MSALEVAEWAKSVQALIDAFPDAFEKRPGTPKLRALCEAFTYAQAELAALRAFVEECAHGQHRTIEHGSGLKFNDPKCPHCRALKLLENP